MTMSDTLSAAAIALWLSIVCTTPLVVAYLVARRDEPDSTL